MYLITIILYTSTFIDPVDRNELFTSGICSWRGALQKNNEICVRKYRSIVEREQITQFGVVDAVEEDHSTDADLGERSDAHFLRLHVLMLPAPESFGLNRIKMLL